MSKGGELDTRRPADWAPEQRIREIFAENDRERWAVLEAVATEFGWTIQQAYIATEFLFRPENTN